MTKKQFLALFWLIVAMGVDPDCELGKLSLLISLFLAFAFFVKTLNEFHEAEK